MLNILAQVLNTDPETIPTSTPTPDIGAAFVKMLLTFGALIALLFFTYWMVRKLIQFRLQKGVGIPSIQVLEKKMISAKTMLYLVQVDDKKILLAESHLEIKRLESLTAEPPSTEAS